MREGGRPVNSLARAAGGQRSVLAMIGLLAATGCTICPSPYDYSGPVPNGSVTQNDFCARSGGTRPLRNGPLVWPHVVQADGKPGAAAGELPEASGPEADDASILVASATDQETEGTVVTTSAEVEVEQVEAEQEELSWRRLAR